MSELREAFSETHHACFPVVGPQGGLLGVVDDQALRIAVCDDAVRDVLVAADLVEAAPLLVRRETLQSAMHKMVSSGRDELVVVDDEDESLVVGMLSRRDLVAAYDHQVRLDQDLRDQSEGLAWSFLSRPGVQKKKKVSPPPVGGGGGGSRDGETGATGG